ncbi:hypothetical protein GOV05_04985 [Candidatus Woesearchaeota archaeon]|nr:hypothetical protein [Candidatus Woesearchaeota archaeon]
MLKRINILIILFSFILAIYVGFFPSLVLNLRFVYLLLIILGSFAGLFNVFGEKNKEFLIANVAFIISATAINNILENYFLLNYLSHTLNNLVLFLAPATIVVAFKPILEFLSDSKLIFDIKDDKKKKGYTPWDIVILYTVAIVLITLVIELFFDVSDFEGVLNTINWIIFVIFLLDLGVLYQRSKGIKDFAKSYWLDVIATVPLGQVFKLAKFFRFVRIVKILSKTGKASKIIKAERLTKFSELLKFFSNKSGLEPFEKDEAVKKKK